MVNQIQNMPKLATLPAILFAASHLSGCQFVEDKQPNQPLWQNQKSASSLFQNKTEALAKQVEDFCRAPEQAGVDALRTGWQQSMSAWMPLQGIDMGSEQLLSLSWQIQFYPDKKNTTGRKLRQLLKEEKILTQGQMASQSVAVQGLGALEWLLFDKASNITDSKNCALASQISTYLSSTAKQYHGAWAVNPFSGANDKAQVKNSLSALSHQLDRVMKKLSMPLGKPGLSKPFQAEAWRSAQSLNFLRDSVSSMKVLYDADLRELLVQRGADDLANRIDEHWDTALESIPQQPGMKSLLSSVDGYRSLLTVFNNLEYIQLALSDEAAPLLGVVVGFNSTDGD